MKNMYIVLALTLAQATSILAGWCNTNPSTPDCIPKSSASTSMQNTYWGNTNPGSPCFAYSNSYFCWYVSSVVGTTTYYSAASCDTSNSACLAPEVITTTTAAPVPAGYGSNCKVVRGSGLTQAQRDKILNDHNTLRAKVASMQQPPQPGAKNMRKLEWDSSLESNAQAWANQCKYEHSTFGQAQGQNLALFMTSSSTASYSFDGTDRWFSEVKDFDPAWVNAFQTHPNSSIPIGHYSQVVWANTDKVGCGYISYEPVSPATNMPYWHYLVCNYLSQGNILTTKVYIPTTVASEVASQCPTGYVKSGSLCQKV